MRTAAAESSGIIALNRPDDAIQAHTHLRIIDPEWMRFHQGGGDAVG